MVDISMTDGSLAWLMMEAGRYFGSGDVPRRGEVMLSGGIICYRPYEAEDGWITCGALEPKFWAAFCRGVGREDLIERQFEQPGSDAHREVAEIFKTSDPRGVAVPSTTSTTHASSRSWSSTRRSSPSSSASARWSSPTSSRSSGEVRQLGFPVKLSPDAGATSTARRRRSASTPPRCWPRPATRPRRSQALEGSGAAKGPDAAQRGALPRMSVCARVLRGRAEEQPV